MSTALLQQKLQTAIDLNRALATERDSLRQDVAQLELCLEDIAFSSSNDQAATAMRILEKRKASVRVRKESLL